MQPFKQFLTQNKKIVSILGAAIIVIIAGSIWYHFATTEQVTINTNNPEANITLTTISDNKPRNLGKGSASLRLPFGNYNIQVTNGEDETRTAIKVEQGQSITRDIQLVSTKQPEKIGEYGARNIIATNDYLQYLVPVYGRIDRFTFSQNIARAINPDMGEFVSATWITDSKALLQDINSTAYLLDGASTTPLPYEIRPGTLSILPNGTFAYADFEGVKVRPGALENPTYNLKVEATAPGIALGAKNRLLVYETAISTRTEDTTQAVVQPVVYEGDRKLEKANELLKGMDIGGGSWSPDGNLLVVTSTQGIFALDIVNSTLTQLYGAQSTHAGSLKWVDDKTVLYYLDTKLWRIEVATQTWSKVASITQSLSTNDTFALAPDKKTLYFSIDADASGLTGVLYRLKIN